MEGDVVPTEVVDEEKDDVGCRRSGKGSGESDDEQEEHVVILLKLPGQGGSEAEVSNSYKKTIKKPRTTDKPTRPQVSCAL